MLPHFIDEKIKNIAKKEGYVTFEIDHEDILKNGTSYMGDLYKVNIKGKSVEGDVKETNVFIKKIVRNELMAGFFSLTVAYKNELFAYKELFEVYNELQEEYKVPMEKRFKTARCFDESNEDVLILENLAYKGFKTYGKTDYVSLKFVELSVQQLAEFHALSLALQTVRPTYWEARIKTSLEAPFTSNEERKAYLTSLMSVVVENIKDVTMKKKLEEFIPVAFQRYKQCLSNRSEIPVLCHGDYRVLNLMVKEINGSETEVIPVDYQFIYYGCPINDLVSCFFSGTTSHIRLNHMEQLKELYYCTLVKFCEYFNIDMKNKLPRSKFEEIFKERLDLGLIVATIFAPLIYATEDSMLNMENKVDGKMKIKLDDKFQEKYVDVVRNFIEWGYL